MFCKILRLKKMERREQRYSNKIIKIFFENTGEKGWIKSSLKF